nr:serine--tRNA ligase [bacterium]
MLDIKKIRNQPEEIIRGLRNKNQKNADATIDSILKKDEDRRLCIEKANALKNQRNVVSQQIAEMKKSGNSADGQILEMRTVSEEIKKYDRKIKNFEGEIFDILLQIPNLPSETSPVGRTEDENVEIRQWGEKKNFGFALSDHLVLGKTLGLFDLNRGSKISGSGFPLYTGKGAKLERALINFMLDYHSEHHGYTEIFPPFLVNRDSLTNTGQIPKLEEDMYFCEKDELFLIPTAEVPVTNIFKDEILKEDRLPIKYSAYSSCFRR